MIALDEGLTVLQKGILEVFADQESSFTSEELMSLTGTFSRHAIDVSSRDLSEKGYLIENKGIYSRGEKYGNQE